MSTIKLPVIAVIGKRLWSVCDADGVELVTQQPESVSKQIALALNLHDDLVAELERLRDILSSEDCEIINVLLARAETDNENKI